MGLIARFFETSVMGKVVNVGLNQNLGRCEDVGGKADMRYKMVNIEYLQLEVGLPDGWDRGTCAHRCKAATWCNAAAH
jgi:hypothetical protein